MNGLAQVARTIISRASFAAYTRPFSITCPCPGVPLSEDCFLPPCKTADEKKDEMAERLRKESTRRCRCQVFADYRFKNGPSGAHLTDLHGKDCNCECCKERRR